MACLLKVLGLYLLLQRRKTRQPHPTVDPALRSTGANQIPWTTGTAGLIRSMMADWDRSGCALRRLFAWRSLQRLQPALVAHDKPDHGHRRLDQEFVTLAVLAFATTHVFEPG